MSRGLILNITENNYEGFAYAYSEKGKNHIVCNRENQDYWCVFQKDGTIAFAVADGVGSCRKCEIGARRAIEAVKTVCENGVYSMSGEKICEAIWMAWKESVEYPYSDYSTTLRFVICNDNRIIIGSVGDGITLIENPLYIELSDKGTFRNVTEALGQEKPHFDSREMTAPKVLRIVIMTDGVANEIIPEKKKEFLEYLSNLTEEEIDDEVVEWFESISENNGDDKTIVFANVKRVYNG